MISNYDELISFEALDESFRLCKHGVMWKETPAEFSLNELREVYNLRSELLAQTYEIKPVKTFHITYPKPREILSVAFRDRVYQRSINDNALYPAMSPSFTASNCACQKGKGTDYAINLLKKYLHQYFRKFGRTGFVVQFDIHGYYKNMSHSLPKTAFRRYIKDNRTYNQIVHVLDSQYEGDIGFLPGSQMVQIAGITALSSLDHYIKEKLRIKYYIRYMDDFLLIHQDRAYAEICMRKILKFLSKLKLSANPSKTHILPIQEGIKFLGFHFKLTQTGSVKLHVLSQNISHRRHMLYALSNKVRTGQASLQSFDDSFQSWKSHINRSPNSHNMFQEDV